jgi:hypothetical protein
MSGTDELGDDGGADTARGARNEDSHRADNRQDRAELLRTAMSQLRDAIAGLG